MYPITGITQEVVEYRDITLLNKDLEERNKNDWKLDYLNTAMVQHLVGGAQLIYLAIYTKEIQEEIENGKE